MKLRHICAAVALAILLALSAAALGEPQPIDFDGDFSDLADKIMEIGFWKDNEGDGRESTWLDEQCWDGQTGAMYQYRLSFFGNAGSDPVNDADFARIRANLEALFGAPIAERGDGADIDLLLVPKANYGGTFQPLQIEGGTVESEAYGTVTKETVEVLDGCLFAFYVQAQPAVAHLALLNHDEIPDNAMAKPRNYNSVDVRVTALSAQDYAAVLAQAGVEGYADVQPWQPPMKVRESLNDMVFKALEPLCNWRSPHFDLRVEQVGFDSSSVR